jgi:hypothetical protein
LDSEISNSPLLMQHQLLRPLLYVLERLQCFQTQGSALVLMQTNLKIQWVAELVLHVTLPAQHVQDRLLINVLHVLMDYIRAEQVACRVIILALLVLEPAHRPAKAVNQAPISMVCNVQVVILTARLVFQVHRAVVLVVQLDDIQTGISALNVIAHVKHAVEV